MIRPATNNDLSKISLIENRVFRFPWSDDQIRWELRSQHVASNYVKLLEDNIIGYIFTHKIDKEVQILNFAIDTSYQHKGYGEEFFSYFMDQLDEDISIILEEYGSNLSKVVDVYSMLIDMERDFEGYNEIYSEYFSKIMPSRTTCSVSALPTPIAVELKVIAKV